MHRDGSSVLASGFCPACGSPLIRESRKRGIFGGSWQGSVVEYHCTPCKRAWREGDLSLVSSPPRLAGGGGGVCISS